MGESAAAARSRIAAANDGSRYVEICFFGSEATPLAAVARNGVQALPPGHRADGSPRRYQGLWRAGSAAEVAFAHERLLHLMFDPGRTGRIAVARETGKVFEFAFALEPLLFCEHG